MQRNDYFVANPLLYSDEIDSVAKHCSFCIVTNWMLWKGPSAKDIWQGVDSKTMFVFDKVITMKEQNICGKCYLMEGLFKQVFLFVLSCLN